MAQKISVTLVDDLDGTEATQTVKFGYDGATYEIDLSRRNASAFDKAMGRFVGAARRVNGKAPAKKAAAKPTGPTAKEVRAWAQEQGIEVNPTGRVPEGVREQYLAAH